MIVPLRGNVAFRITLDPTVWIFDDRKVILEEAFTQADAKASEEDDLKRQAEIFDEVYLSKHNRPPTQKTTMKVNRQEILNYSYVIPLKDFVLNAEAPEGTERVLLKTNDEDVIISYEQLVEGYALFAIDGKPLKEDGPIHFVFGDGSNVDNPIKHVKAIEVQ